MHPLYNKSGPTQPTFRLPLFICAKRMFQVSHDGPRGLKLSELVAMETWKCVLRVRHAQLARRTRAASKAFQTMVRVHWLREGGAGVLVLMEKCTEVLRNPGTFGMPYEQHRSYICRVVDRPECGLPMQRAAFDCSLCDHNGVTPIDALACSAKNLRITSLEQRRSNSHNESSPAIKCVFLRNADIPRTSWLK